jgi:hypothetical protein
VVYAGADGNGLAIRDLTGDLRPEVVTVADGFSRQLAVLENRCLLP